MKAPYKALTRSYRPQTFDDIVSQEHVSNTLKNAIRTNRLSHAYMFCGPRGVGKTTMARVLAREVNQVSSDVDGELLTSTLNIVEMDAASNRKIDDIRALKEVIRVPPQNGRYKIFIIDEVHMLTTEAFNALLKTLEEPPPHAIFIFATTEPHKVLPTILSRVQRFDFKRISVPEIVERLRRISERENIEVDDESLHVIAKRADGALRDALGLMDQAIAYCGEKIEYRMLPEALNIVDAEHFFTLMEIVRKRDADAGLNLINRLIQAGTDIQEFLVGLTEHLRNLYVARSFERLHLVEATEETKARIREQATHFPEDDLLRMLHLVSETQLKLKEATQPRIHFEILILKLIHMSRAEELSVLINEVKGLKKKTDNRRDGARGESRQGETWTVEPEGAPSVTHTEPPVRNAPPASNPLPEQVAVPSPPNSLPRGQRAPSYARAGNPAQAAPHQGIGQAPSGRFREETVKAAEAAPEERLPAKSGSEAPQGTPGGIKSVGDVIEKWEEFLSGMEKEIPKILYFQLQRCRPGELRGDELTLVVDNEFGARLIDEHRQELSRSFNRAYNTQLVFRCRVERNPEEKRNRMSPYERFLELQKKDPKLRVLVELFGAELEY